MLGRLYQEAGKPSLFLQNLEHIERLEPSAKTRILLKEMYYEGDGEVVMGRKAIIGALRLYLDFINLFMFLLQFLGNRN